MFRNYFVTGFDLYATNSTFRMCKHNNFKGYLLNVKTENTKTNNYVKFYLTIENGIWFSNY